LNQTEENEDYSGLLAELPQGSMTHSPTFTGSIDLKPLVSNIVFTIMREDGMPDHKLDEQSVSMVRKHLGSYIAVFITFIVFFGSGFTFLYKEYKEFINNKNDEYKKISDERERINNLKVDNAAKSATIEVIKQYVDIKQKEIKQKEIDIANREDKVRDKEIRAEKEKSLRTMINDYVNKFGKIDISKDYSCSQEYLDLKEQAEGAILAIENEAKKLNDNTTLNTFVFQKRQGISTLADMCRKSSISFPIHNINK